MSMHNPVNKMLLDEIGLTVDANHRVIDQDTRQPVIIKDRYLKYSAYNSVPVHGRQEQVFDPCSNRGQMGFLFEYYVAKLDSEGEPIDMYYETQNGEAIEVKREGECLESGIYNNETLKFVDVIMQLNQSSSIEELHKYDSKKKPITGRKQREKVNFER